MAKRKVLSLAEIRERARPKVREVEIPALGGAIRIRALTGGELVAYQAEVTAHEKAGKDPGEMAAVLISRCWIGDDDAPLFAGESGLAEVNSFGGDVLQEVTAAVMELNGVSAAQIEEAAKN